MHGAAIRFIISAVFAMFDRLHINTTIITCNFLCVFRIQTDVMNFANMDTDTAKTQTQPMGCDKQFGGSVNFGCTYVSYYVTFQERNRYALLERSVVCRFQ